MAKNPLAPLTPDQQARFAAKRKACRRAVPANVKRKASAYCTLAKRLADARESDVDLCLEVHDREMGVPVTAHEGLATETCRPQNDRELHSLFFGISSIAYLDVRRDPLRDAAVACRKVAIELLRAADRFEAAAARKPPAAKAAPANLRAAKVA
jgi:hypothetical protein